MKKWSAALSLCLLWNALAASGAAAAERPVRVYIDGKQVKFDVQPIVENGTTLVQFRPIFERLGLAIRWDAETQTITGSNDQVAVTLAIDDHIAYINEQANELELTPRLVEGNTLVPLRFVAEASGKEVTWVQATSAVLLKSPPIKKEPKARTEPDKGDYIYPNGDKYTGQLDNGYPEGKGKVYNASGKLVFDGEMSYGIPKDGRYKTYFDNGKLEFDGRMENGVANGDGKQYGPDGKLIFDGSFLNGERSEGTLTYGNGDKYTGPFDNDKPNGTGKLQYKNRDVYEGDFVDGNREGKGTYKTAKGERIVGDFKYNMMNGVIYHYDQKGTLLSISEYSNDELVRKMDMANDSSTLPSLNSSTPFDQTSTENERHSIAMSDIRERYNQEKKQLEQQLSQVRKDNPGLYASQAQYDKALEDAHTKQADLIDSINEWSKDTSYSVTAIRMELEKQLADNQKLIEQITGKGSAQRLIEELKDQLASLRTVYYEELSDERDRHEKVIQKLK
jgi:hypothetical protein